MKLNIKLASKNEYRKYAKKLRANLDMAQISHDICKMLQKQDFYSSKNILCFYPFGNEVDFRELYKDTSKNWYLPKVLLSPKGLVIHPYQNGDSLVKNSFGVYEPCCDEILTDIYKIDIAIIPALMADKNGYRLGYGAGFYDRFIPGLRKDCLKITAVPEELFIDSLPFDHWDIPVNKIITPEGVYNTDF